MSDVLRTLSSAYRSALGRSGLLGSQRRSPDDRLAASCPRGRLFRKYVLLIVGLVSLVLLLNSALDFWFSYEENKAALFRIQQEKAGSAARRIEQFVDEIERQLGWTTRAAMGRQPARAAPFRLCPPVAPGAGDHRIDPARRRRQGAAQGLAAGDGCGRQREGLFPIAELHRSEEAPRLVQPGLFPQGIRAVHDHGGGSRRAQCRGHGRRGQSEADLGRDYRAEDRTGTATPMSSIATAG